MQNGSGNSYLPTGEICSCGRVRVFPGETLLRGENAHSFYCNCSEIHAEEVRFSRHVNIPESSNIPNEATSSHGPRTTNSEIRRRSTHSGRPDPHYLSDWQPEATVYYSPVIPRNSFSYWITLPHHPWSWPYSQPLVPSSVNSNYGFLQLQLSPSFFTGYYFFDLHTRRVMNRGHRATPRTLHQYYFPMAVQASQNQARDVSAGLSREVISAHLRCVRYQRPVPDDEKCCICQDDYCDGQIVGVADCGHKFHPACISQWLTQRNSCPLCQRIALWI